MRHFHDNIFRYLVLYKETQYNIKESYYYRGMETMDYLTVREISKKWGLGSRMVNIYCVTGRIKGVIKKGNMWLIPKDAPKPADRRYKKTTVIEKEETILQRGCKGGARQNPQSKTKYIK